MFVGFIIKLYCKWWLPSWMKCIQNGVGKRDIEFFICICMTSLISVDVLYWRFDIFRKGVEFLLHARRCQLFLPPVLDSGLFHYQSSIPYKVKKQKNCGKMKTHSTFISKIYNLFWIKAQGPWKILAANSWLYQKYFYISFN